MKKSVLLSLSALVLNAVAGTATGFFHVERHADGRWWMVNPDGTDTFLAGCGSCWYHGAVCEALGYEPYRRANDATYPSMHAWGSNVVSRLKAWGFNALSGNDFLFHRGLAHAELLTLGEDFARRGGPENSLTPYEGFPCSAFPNVFNPAFADWCREVAAKRCAAAKDDASLSGYFLDNELAWWGRDTSARGTIESRANERHEAASATETPRGPAMSKSKVAFVLLGVFLGSLGIHNFYIGRTKQGVIQLLITVLSAGMLSLASWIWAIVDICTINADASGVPLS